MKITAPRAVARYTHHWVLGFKVGIFACQFDCAPEIDPRRASQSLSVALEHAYQLQLTTSGAPGHPTRYTSTIFIPAVKTAKDLGLRNLNCASRD